MTSLIDNNIDELIKRVRQRTAVSDMVFMTAYPPREMPNPIGKYSVAVDQAGVSGSQVFIGDAVNTGLKGRLYKVKLTLRVYAPRNTSASALLRMSALLFDAIDHSDTGGAIVDMSLGGVDYDNTARTLFRDLHLTLSWILTGEVAR